MGGGRRHPEQTEAARQDDEQAAQVEVLGQLRDGPQQRQEGVLVDDRPEEVTLVLEVVIDEALGDVGRTSDVSHRRAVESLFREEMKARLEDVLAPVAPEMMSLGQRIPLLNELWPRRERSLICLMISSRASLTAWPTSALSALARRWLRP